MRSAAKMPPRPELVVIVPEFGSRVGRTSIFEKLGLLVEQHGVVELSKVQLRVVERLHAVLIPVVNAMAA